MTGKEYASERKALGMNQDELADALAISARKVQRIERSSTVARDDEYALRWVVSMRRREMAR